MRLVNVWWIVPAMALFAFSAVAQSGDEAAALVADQVREQGFACAEPTSAERDPAVDDDAVWMLACADANYRVRLVPDQAARIEKLD